MDATNNMGVNNPFFRKIYCLVHGLGRRALQEVLDQNVPPETLYRKLQSCRGPLWKELNQDQKDLLFPKGLKNEGQNEKDLSSLKMDISLLYKLLRHVARIPSHANGWGKDPEETDWNESANIERIVKLRNKLSHDEYSNIGQIRFKAVWLELSKAIQSLCKDDLKEEINNILEKDLQIQEFEEFVRMKFAKQTNLLQEELVRMEIKVDEIKSMFST